MYKKCDKINIGSVQGISNRKFFAKKFSNDPKTFREASFHFLKRY